MNLLNIFGCLQHFTFVAGELVKNTKETLKNNENSE